MDVLAGISDYRPGYAAGQPGQFAGQRVVPRHHARHVAGYAIAVPLASKPRFQSPASLSLAAFIAGLTLVAGSLLRRHCWRMLGASFTGDVRVQAGQSIVTTGAYTRLRHPSYTAGILMHTGFGIALGSWGSALVLALVSLAIYSYRIHVEEQALVSALGQPYRHFLRGRKRLIPFIY